MAPRSQLHFHTEVDASEGRGNASFPTCGCRVRGKSCTGDMDESEIYWVYVTAQKHRSENFLQFMLASGMVQHVTHATR